MRKKHYVAYGSNLNIEQMARRCPGAKLVGTGVIKNYELQFKGREGGAFATISPKLGAETPIAIWSITEADERFLDRYEGFPSHYFKEDVPVEVNGKRFNAMAYVMNLRAKFSVPSSYYYSTVAKGYQDCGLDQSYLEEAVADSAKQFYRRNYLELCCSQPSSQEESTLDDDDEYLDDEEDTEGWQMRI